VPSPLAGGLIAILRARRGDHLDAVLDTLVEAGVHSLEITLNTPDALPALRRARHRFGPDIALGAGTVRSVAAVDAAVEAGAQYIVCPHTDPAIGERCHAAQVAWLPGGFTATEVATAWGYGATAVKLFPARLGGPRYLRDLREPLDDIPIVPTGGVNAETVGDWFAAGAVAVGAGGPLVGDALDTGDLTALRARAARLVAAVAEARS
jgi:2-dehydro-3-deoxyphosphogluconate aldolase/(4S)-4-hydroxy-2-oxoglutarate aldolase